MDVKIQNCAAGVFVLNYPKSMGNEALGDCYCLAKEQLGNNILVPIEEGCSLSLIKKKKKDNPVYVFRFPLDGSHDLDTINDLFFSVKKGLGETRVLVGIPDDYSLSQMPLEQLNSIRDEINQYVDWLNQIALKTGGTNG